MVNVKLVNLNVVLLSILVVFVLASTTYERISYCYFYQDLYGYDVTLECAEIDNAGQIFPSHHRIVCTDKNSQYIRDILLKDIREVNFRNCEFVEFKQKYFKIFNDLPTFNTSDVGLEKLQIVDLEGAHLLRSFIASNNRLTEIPSRLFTNAKKLKYTDLSNNSIYRIDPLAFDGVQHLQTLNLSHNQINQLDQHWLIQTGLLTLDLSHNNLTILNEHAFDIDTFTDLTHLNLSFNQFGNLKIGTFAYLTNLEFLSLRHANISSIQLGTFAHQHKIRELDLSENRLIEFNFNLFLPVLHDLKSLFLNGNQLSDLRSFRNPIVPQLILLDIKNNNFNCSDLIQFTNGVNWEKLHLSIDPRLTDVQRTNIRGINCEGAIEDTTTTSQQEENYRAEVRQVRINVSDEHVLLQSIHTNLQSILDEFLQKFALVFMCITLSIFLAILLVLNRDRLFKTANLRLKSSSDQTVKYTNEKPLLEFLQSVSN